MKTASYTTRAFFAGVFLSALLFSSSGAAGSAGDPFLSRLQGSWLGEGKTLGMSARLQMKWEWVLGNKFLRLSLRNEMQGATGTVQVLEGHAYYQPVGEAKYEGNWFDSRGVSFQLKGQLEGETLTALWGAPGQESGKSSYKFLEAGKLEVVDSVKQKDGTWKEFGRFVVVRQ